jgi:succinate dehydrogenase/fumarate reductase flavoprotein subunit
MTSKRGRRLSWRSASRSLKEGEPVRWDDETEVLIIGFGGAGAVAAITAHDAGARVLIVEKMEKGGGNTNISIGGFLCLNDLPGALQYLESLCSQVFRTVDPEMVRTYAEECMKNREWFERQGARTHVYGRAGFPQLPGAESVEKRMITGKNTVEENSLWNFLRSRVEERQILVWYSSPVRDLITGPKGEVVGAVVRKAGAEKRIKSRRGVILTCGGFEYDEWLKANYLKGYPYYSLGSPGNTGDGVRMAQRVGAELWHMAGISCALGFKTPEFEAAFIVKPPSSRYLFVDQGGKRFVSETDIHHYNFLVDIFDPHTLTFPRIPCFLVFDQTARVTGAMAVPAIGYNRGRYSWSRDNGEEISRGWISSGGTPGDLGEKIGVNAPALENTIREYNLGCEKGEDPLGRPKDKLVPLGPGPYYGMKLWPCLINTQGGPRRNGRGQVVYPDGTPIPRLYSAGELGSLFGLLYQGAGNIGECLAFGRIAGREAARESVWGKT